MTEVKRYGFLDIAKGLGILSVVWAHIMLVGWSHKIIYAFHMPLFFFIAGMFFAKEKYPSFGPFVKKKFHRLLIPYFVYAILSWLLWVCFQFLGNGHGVDIWRSFLQIFICQGSGRFLVFNSALWFIPCLFLVEVLYYYISRLNDLLNFLLTILLAVLSFKLGRLWGNEYWLSPFWNFDAVLIALPFYGVGNLLTKIVPANKMEEWVDTHRFLSLFVWAVSFALLAFLSMRYGECSMGSSSYQCKESIFMIRAFIGIAAMVFFSLFIERVGRSWGKECLVTCLGGIRWLGKNSLDVMCLHVPIKGVVAILIAKVLRTTVTHISSSYLLSGAVFLITVSVSILIIIVINKRFRK